MAKMKKSKGMKAGALKKGGGAKLGKAGAKLGPSAGPMPGPPRQSGGALGGGGASAVSKARTKRLQDVQL